MCFSVYTLHAGKWCRWCQWQRPKRMIKRWRDRNTYICIRGAGNTVIWIVSRPWMQLNPDPVWSRKNRIYFCSVIFKNKLPAELTSMSVYLRLWFLDRASYISSLFHVLWGLCVTRHIHNPMCKCFPPRRNHNRRYLFNTFALLVEQLHSTRQYYSPNRPPCAYQLIYIIAF